MRKLFGTDGVRGVANEYPMTAEMALKLGQTIGHVIKTDHQGGKVVVGKDTRLSGYMLEYAIVSGHLLHGGGRPVGGAAAHAGHCLYYHLHAGRRRHRYFGLP
jgi:hypothetical protein